MTLWQRWGSLGSGRSFSVPYSGSLQLLGASMSSCIPSLDSHPPITGDNVTEHCIDVFSFFNWVKDIEKRDKKILIFRCEIEGCNSTGYDGYIWEPGSGETQSCRYYEAKRGEDGMCERGNNSQIRSCRQGPYIIEDFEFEKTTITEFNVLCEEGSTEEFFRSVSWKVFVKMVEMIWLGSFISGCIHWLFLHDWFSHSKLHLWLFVRHVWEEIWSFG